jgi:hypothetical protein
MSIELKAFDVIAGSNHGGWTDRDIAAHLAAILGAVEDDGIVPHNGYGLLRASEEMFRDLAGTHDENIILQDYVDQFYDLVYEYLPPYTGIDWHDNELIVLPCVESMLEDMASLGAIGDELPDDTVAKPGQYAVVSDHGNVAYYEHNGKRWVEIWTVV